MPDSKSLKFVLVFFSRYVVFYFTHRSKTSNLIDNFESHIYPNDPTNNCLDVAIITAPEKRTKKTIEKFGV